MSTRFTRAWWDQIFAPMNVETASGEDLDKIAELAGIPRHSDLETDAELRARLHDPDIEPGNWQDAFTGLGTLPATTVPVLPQWYCPDYRCPERPLKSSPDAPICYTCGERMTQR